MRLCKLLAAIAFIGVQFHVTAAMSQDGSVLTGLGDLPGGAHASEAFAISADGKTAVGFGTTASGEQAIRWTQASGMSGLGDLPGGRDESRAHAVSGDGKIIAGFSNAAAGDRAFLWTVNHGLKPLPAEPNHGAPITVLDMSVDGQVLAGRFDGRPRKSFTWNRAKGYTLLESQVQIARKAFDMRANVTSLSQNGRIAVGCMQSDQIDFMTASLWIDGAGVPLRRREFSKGAGNPAFIFTRSLVSDVNCDAKGKVRAVVGQYQNKNRLGVRGYWIGNGTFHWLENQDGSKLTSPDAVCGDGSMVVGSGRGRDGKETAACLWTEKLGVVVLGEWLQSRGVDLQGWQLTDAVDLSADGRVLVGNGINPEGKKEAWILTLSERLLVAAKPDGASALARSASYGR